jgi:hypothetical protein
VEKREQHGKNDSAHEPAYKNQAALTGAQDDISTSHFFGRIGCGLWGAFAHWHTEILPKLVSHQSCDNSITRQAAVPLPTILLAQCRLARIGWLRSVRAPMIRNGSCERFSPR